MSNKEIATALIQGIDTVEKDIALDEFLLLYNYEIKTNEEEFEKIYFPPGNKDYTMSLASMRFSVVTEDYAEFYGLTKDDCRYYIDVLFSQDGRSILSAKIYSFNNTFNRITSRFTLITNINETLTCKDVDDGIRKIVAKRNSALYKVKNSEAVPYSKIKQK